MSEEERRQTIVDHKGLAWILKFWPIVATVSALFFGLIAYASATKVRELARVEAASVTMTPAEVKEIVTEHPSIVIINTKLESVMKAQDETNRKLDRLLTRRDER